MATIIFQTADGTNHHLEGQDGSLMALAVESNIEGIGGDCGGVCSCATCHVHVAQDDYDKTGQPDEIERDMLELVDNLSPTSRLCCQIEISDAIDGIKVKVVRE